jgi:hypothetical protein
MTIKSVAYRLRKFVEGAAYSAAFIFISNNSYLLYVTYPGFRRDFFHLGPFFYKNSLKSRREFQKSSCLYSRIRYIVLV